MSQYRTQLLLDEDRYLWLKDEAKAADKSIAQMVRDMIDEKKQEREKRKQRKYTAAYGRLLALAGSIKEKGGVNDVSENHDKYLGEALYQEIVSKRK